MLRPATGRDFAFIRSVAGNPSNIRFIDDEDEAALSKHISDPDAVLIVWEHAATLEGFALFNGRTSRSKSLELRRLALARPGTGLGREFLADLRDHAFADLGADCLWLDVATDNHRARHIYESVGFVFEGRLRARWKRPSGDVADLDVLSILRSEWVKSPSSARPQAAC